MLVKKEFTIFEYLQPPQLVVTFWYWYPGYPTFSDVCLQPPSLHLHQLKLTRYRVGLLERVWLGRALRGWWLGVTGYWQSVTGPRPITTLSSPPHSPTTLHAHLLTQNIASANTLVLGQLLLLVQTTWLLTQLLVQNVLVCIDSGRTSAGTFAQTNVLLQHVLFLLHFCCQSFRQNWQTIIQSQADQIF